MRKVLATPENMVEKGGTIHFGTFRTPFVNANILDVPLYAFSRNVPAFWKNSVSKNGSTTASLLPLITLAWSSSMQN